MNKVILLILTFWFSQTVCGQTFNEWFFQKKTQIKYLHQQIAALAAYMTVLEKGYSIVQEGTATINGIKHGDFDLHQGYFTSLKTVNPELRSNPKVADTRALAGMINQNYQACLQGMQGSNDFSPDEIASAKAVLGNAVSDAADKVAYLTSLVTDGNLEMTDEQRLQAINDVNSAMQRLYRFSQAYCNSVSLLAIQRAQEQFDANTGKLLYGIK